ncbi:MAG: hypothetical protein ACJASL_002839 [Paraglaciecola sp.]|jgi:hypothetical protein
MKSIALSGHFCFLFAAVGKSKLRQHGCCVKKVIGTPRGMTICTAYVCRFGATNKKKPAFAGFKLIL